MRTNNRRPQPSRLTGETISVFVLIGLVLLVLATVSVAAQFGHQIAGLPPPPADPWTTLFGVIKGDVAWPVASTVIAGGVLLALAALVVLVWWVVVRRRVDRRLPTVQPGPQHAQSWGTRVRGRGRLAHGSGRPQATQARSTKTRTHCRSLHART